MIISSLGEAQLELSKFIECFETTDTGEKAVDGQRNYMAGVIDTLFILGRITENVQAALHYMYFQGFSFEDALETFAVPV